MDPPEHPAKFSQMILGSISLLLYLEHGRLGREIDVLDPMAGVGGIHTLDALGMIHTYGVEIEPEWASQHPQTIEGDATDLSYPNESFDVVATSPPYGNRMADVFVPKDNTRRVTYYHMLGRRLHEHSTAGLHWGPEYRRMMTKIYIEIKRVLRPKGLFVLNVSNFIQDKQEVDAVTWHLDTQLVLGYDVVGHDLIETQRMRYGENSKLRVDYEHVIAFRKE